MRAGAAAEECMTNRARDASAKGLAMLIVTYMTRFAPFKKAPGNLLLPKLFGSGRLKLAHFLARLP